MRNFLFCIVFVASLHSLAPFEAAKFNGVFIFDNLAAQDFQNLNFQNLNVQITATQTHETSPNYSILQKSHEIIKLPQAYIQNPNIKGNGVNIGIIDSSFNPEHPSLKGKMIDAEKNNFEFNKYGDDGLRQRAERDTIRHGSHVAGIILGADLKTPNTPMGIAPEAKFYGVAYLNPVNPYDTNRYNAYNFLKDKNIKIIKNSWNGKYYPLINRDIATTRSYSQILQNPDRIADWMRVFIRQEPMLSHIHNLSRDFGILNIVGVGNEGVASPGAIATLPSFDESLRSWLAVAMIDARSVEILSDGRLKINSVINNNPYISENYISNALVGAQLYGITAPGAQIDSANAYYKDAIYYDAGDLKIIENDPMGGIKEFVSMSGTSQATPMVSGAAILVQQKYPFLSGAQIADVLLSTANKDFETDKIIVKKGEDISPNTFNDLDYYNVIYVQDGKNPNPIPKKANGTIDLDKVKDDLKSVGYINADDIVKNRLYERRGQAGNEYEGIFELTKEQIFGQGILDVAKALNGIAILDANRLNSENVQNFNGKNYAFYTINTQGQSGEFSNNISQKKWDDDLHLSNALNSPRDTIRGLDVGLLKTGAGTLILSGNNTYSAPTRVNNGTLKIQGEASNFGNGVNGADNLDSVKTSARGVLVNSQSFSESKGAILQLESAYLPKGAVAQNGGIVLITQNVRIDSEILARNGGEFRISESSTLYLGNSTKRETAALINGGVLSGEGTIYGNVLNFSGVVKAGFSESAPTLDSEKTLTIQGEYSQHKDGVLMLAFDGRDSANTSNSNTINTKISATSYDIQGGKLVYTPIFLGLSSQRIKDGQKFVIDIGDLQDKIDEFSLVEATNTNTLKFQLSDDKTSFEALRRTDAFTPQNTGNTSIGLALTQIANLQNLDDKYANFLGNLDVNAKPQEFQETLESIENNAYLDAIQQSFNDIFAQGIENLNFISTPMNSFYTSPKTAFNDFGTNGVRNDFGTSTLDIQKSKSQFVLNTNATNLKHKKYSSNIYGGGFALKSALDESKIFGVFFDYSNANSVHKFSSVKSDKLGLGAGLNAKFAVIDWFVLGSVGYGKNTTNRQIFGVGENLKGSFDNYQIFLQTGISKDFDLTNFNFANIVLKPMLGVSHTMIYQNSFSESDGIFSKEYDEKNFGISSLLAGGNANMNFVLKRGASVSVGAFAFYTQRFNTSLKGSAIFNDFKDISFSQNAQVSDSGVYFGANANVAYKQYFASLGLYTERSRFYTLNSATANFGILF